MNAADVLAGAVVRPSPSSGAAAAVNITMDDPAADDCALLAAFAAGSLRGDDGGGGQQQIVGGRRTSATVSEEDDCIDTDLKPDPADPDPVDPASGEDLPPDFNLEGIFDVDSDGEEDCREKKDEDEDEDEDENEDAADADADAVSTPRRESDDTGYSSEAADHFDGNAVMDQRHWNHQGAMPPMTTSSGCGAAGEEELFETVNNYDVLLARATSSSSSNLAGGKESSSSSFGGYIFAPPSHVGNNRLRVIVSMHQPVYEAALGSLDCDEECDRAAIRIVDTICLNCVPNGRFLERVETVTTEGGGGGPAKPALYRNIGTEKAKDVVRAFADRCFGGGGEEAKGGGSSEDESSAMEGGDRGDENAYPEEHRPQRRRSSASAISITKPLREGVSRIALSSPSPEPIAEETAEEERAEESAERAKQQQGKSKGRPRFKVRLMRRRQRSSAEEDAAGSGSRPDEVRSDGNNAGDAHAPSPDGEKKRGRTSSLIRRSRQSVNDITRKIKEVCTRKSRGKSAHDISNGDNHTASGDGEDSSREFLHAPLSEGIPQCHVSDLDVLVTGEGGEGIRTTDNVGNNRLRVIIDMNRERYSKVRTDDERRAIAMDIVDKCKWKGPGTGPARCSEEVADGDGGDSGGCGGGRFLTQDLLTGLYHEITDEKAAETVMHCLSTKPGRHGATRSVAYVNNEERQKLAVEELMKQRKKKDVLDKAVERRETKKGGGGGARGGGKSDGSVRRDKLGKSANLVMRRDFQEIMKLAKSI